MQPHRRPPTRLLCAWDSPGKNTGVGCHFLLQCMKSEKWKWSRSVMSDPQRPHGLQPTRLLHPWDFPGKSTGVGCHCLLCLWTWAFKYLLESLLSILLAIYQEVELLGHMVIPFLNCCAIVILFSIAATSFYIFTHSVHEFQFFCILTNITLLSIFFSSHPNEMRWYLIVVLICISIMTSELQHFFVYSLAMCLDFF